MARTISEVLKRHIERSGESLYAIAKESGIAYPVLFRFVNGERDLTLRTADKLCQYFKLELKSTRK